MASKTYHIACAGGKTNITLTPGYKGSFVIENGYYFPVEMFGSPIRVGTKILLYSQTNLTENGVWVVISIVSGFVNIIRPVDYIEGFLVNPGEIVLISEGSAFSSRISVLEARLLALENSLQNNSNPKSNPNSNPN